MKETRVTCGECWHFEAGDTVYLEVGHCLCPFPFWTTTPPHVGTSKTNKRASVCPAFRPLKAGSHERELAREECGILIEEAARKLEIADARATLGEEWLAGGVSLAEGIRRKTRALESELASDHCAEREACAQVVESLLSCHPGQRETDDSGHDEALSYAAERIRARGQEKGGTL